MTQERKFSIFSEGEGEGGGGGVTPPMNPAALDVWQGKMAAHESGYKAMLVDEETGEYVIVGIRGLLG